MVAVRMRASKLDTSGFRRAGDQLKKDQARAAHDVADIAGEKMYRNVQAKIRSVGLGKLANAVGYTSSKRKRQLDRTAYAVIYAKGGDESSGGGALDAYSNGATISPDGGQWLAIPSKAVPRLVTAGGRRRRLTPKLWAQAGLNTKIGQLVFVQVKSNLALLVVKRTSLDPKTGRAKAIGKRAPRTRIIPKKDVVAFTLIRQTRRAKRFDKDSVAAVWWGRIPQYLATTLAGYQRGS